MELAAPQRIALYPAGQNERHPAGRGGLSCPLTLSELRGYEKKNQALQAFCTKISSQYEEGQRIPFRAITAIPSHKTHWDKLQTGDWALFYKRPYYFACAQIKFTEQSNELAKTIFRLEVQEEQESLDELFCFFRPDPCVNYVTIDRTAISYPKSGALRFVVIDHKDEVDRIVSVVRAARRHTLTPTS